MTTLKPINSLTFDHIVATGGIGSGIFFSLKGNDTLGREESRMASLLPYNDYCKQHIILHYISVLLGAGEYTGFQCYPIGKVGSDGTGKRLVAEMNAVGMNTSHVTVTEARSTLFSVCFQYPDHEGGNITTAESASNEVSADDIDEFFGSFEDTGSSEIVLAAPEVPVMTRLRLLEQGRKRGSLNVASLLSSEVKDFLALSIFGLVDMLFVNSDEIRKISGNTETDSTETAVLEGIRRLIAINPAITVFVTCGASGVYCYSSKHLEFFPALETEVVSTAGAGDAFLAGTLAGICCGLPILKKDKNAAATWSTATELGILVASMSVTSQHTIHPNLDAVTLFGFFQSKKVKASDAFMSLFNNRISEKVSS
jgi:ribokinase